MFGNDVISDGYEQVREKGEEYLAKELFVDRIISVADFVDPLEDGVELEFRVLSTLEDLAHFIEESSLADLRRILKVIGYEVVHLCIAEVVVLEETAKRLLLLRKDRVYQHQDYEST